MVQSSGKPCLASRICRRGGYSWEKKIVAVWNFVPDLSVTGHPDSNVWPAGAEGERVKRNICNTSDFAFLIFHISHCRTMIVTFSVRL